MINGVAGTPYLERRAGKLRWGPSAARMMTEVERTPNLTGAKDEFSFEVGIGADGALNEAEPARPKTGTGENPKKSLYSPARRD